MSYPKKQASLNGSQYGGQEGFFSATRDAKAQKRKEQLFSLLVNKFRGKFSVDIGGDDIEVDRIIRTEVAQFLESENMTENDLVKLDKRLSDTLAKHGVSKRQGPDSRQRSPPQDDPLKAYNTQDNRGPPSLISGGRAQLASQSRPALSQASKRSRSSAFKDAASNIMQSPGGQTQTVRDDDYWTKIIMHNVE